MPNFRLISFALCPYVQRCVMTLREKEVAYDIDYIDLSDRPDWFVELSPLGKVPVLEVTRDDGSKVVLFESVVINEYLDDATRRIDKAIQDRDFDKALSIVDSATRRRVAVRSVNDRSVDAIAGTLPAERAAEFRADAMRRSYPRVYQRTVGQKSFKKARALPGLDEETLAGIAAIEEAYEAQLAVLNERIRATIHRHQPKETRQAIERIAAIMSGEGDGMLRLVGHDEDDPVRAAFKKRRNLDERYMKQLHATLTPDQVARLPRLPSERRSMPFIMQRSTASD